MLAAEDNAVNQRLIRLLVEKRGHEITLAANGREAVDRYVDEQFDLVLMDVQMPEMNGFEATAAIREIEARTGRHVPVIAMTAHAMKGDRERCLEAGMDDYISKPIDRDVLFEHLDRVAAQATDDTAPLSGWSDAIERLGGDEELLREIARAYLQERAALIGDLQQAVRSGRPERIERAAHTVKGCVANVGAERAVQLALQIEQAGRAGEIAPAAGLLERLRGELAAVDTALTDLLAGEAA